MNVLRQPVYVQVLEGEWVAILPQSLAPSSFGACVAGTFVEVWFEVVQDLEVDRVRLAPTEIRIVSILGGVLVIVVLLVMVGPMVIVTAGVQVVDGGGQAGRQGAAEVLYNVSKIRPDVETHV